MIVDFIFYQPILQLKQCINTLCFAFQQQPHSNQCCHELYYMQKHFMEFVHDQRFHFLSAIFQPLQDFLLGGNFNIGPSVAKTLLTSWG